MAPPDKGIKVGQERLSLRLSGSICSTPFLKQNAISGMNESILNAFSVMAGILQLA